jgi:hypothetical protein
MAKNYRNHSWFMPGDDNARRIEAGERVQLNDSEREATIIDCLANEGVVSYWVQFDDGNKGHVNPDKLTPLVNP